MGNIVITNNGSATETPAVLDENENVITPAIPADPAVTYIINGVQTVIQPGCSTGLAYPPSNVITGA